MPPGKKIFWVPAVLLDKSTGHVSQTEVIKELKQRNHEVRLFCGYKREKKYYGLGKGTITYLPMPSVPKIRGAVYFTGLFFLMLRLLFITKPDVIILDYTVNLISLPLLLLKRLAGGRPRIMMDIRTIPVNVESFRWSIRTFFFSLAMARSTCDGVTFISPFMRDYCSRRVDLSRLRVSIWTSGFNEELFDPDKYTKIRKDAGFELFYHGGITISRGIGSLIGAVKILKDKSYPVSLKLIGNVVGERDIRKLIQDNGLEGTCTLLRPVPYEEIPQIIEDCDLPVIPLPGFIGWRVSSPLKLLEYMAMGKALVLTDIEAHRDVVDGHEFAFLAKSADPEQLASAIERAYQMKDRLKDLGSAARRLALAEHTWRRQADKLLLFIQSL